MAHVFSNVLFPRGRQVLLPPVCSLSWLPAAQRARASAAMILTYFSLNVALHRGLSQSLNPSLQWRHNGHDSVSNHQAHDCLLNRLFRRGPTKTSKLRVTGLCAGNSPVTGDFPAQRPVTRKMFPVDDVIMVSGRIDKSRTPFCQQACKHLLTGNYMLASHKHRRKLSKYGLVKFWWATELLAKISSTLLFMFRILFTLSHFIVCCCMVITNFNHTP